jgi:hypothetical protein
MSETETNAFASYDYKKTQEYKDHRRAMERFDALSPEEKIQTLVDVGILSEGDHRLTKRYGGDAPNPDDD